VDNRCGQTRQNIQNEFMRKKRLALALSMLVVATVIGCNIYLLAKPVPTTAQLYEIDVLFRKGTFPAPKRLNEIAASVGGKVVFTDPILENVAIRLDQPLNTFEQGEHMTKYLKHRYSEIQFAGVNRHIFEPN
jgi:hypothetical protein